MVKVLKVMFLLDKKISCCLPYRLGDVTDVESVEAITRLIYEQHSSLLGRGIALSRLPTVQEALEGNLPFR